MSSADPSDASDYVVFEEAKKKATESIINVNQFYPEITGEIKVYTDKYACLGDNKGGSFEFSPFAPDTIEEEEEEEEDDEKPNQDQDQEEEEGEDKKEIREEEEQLQKENDELLEVSSKDNFAEAEIQEEKPAVPKDGIQEQESSKTKEDILPQSAAEEPSTVEEGKPKDEEPTAEEGKPKDEKPTAEDEPEEEGDVFFTTQMAEPRASVPSDDVLPDHWQHSAPKVLPTMKQVLDTATAEHYSEGMIAMKSSQWPEAIAHLTRCVVLKPREASFYAIRGELYLHLADLQSAVGNYKHACILAPLNKQYFSRLAFIYLFQGQTLFDQGLYAEALEAFTRAAEMQPDRQAYHNRTIACLASMGRHSECLALVNKRLEAESGNADLLVLRARLHHMFRNFTLCFYDIKDALELDPDHAEAKILQKALIEGAQECNNKAVELGLIRRNREALSKISLAIDMDPTVAGYHVKRGAFHRRLGNYNEAIDDYLMALDKTNHDEASPVYKEAQRQLLLAFNDFAVECFKKGFYEEAVVLLNKAIKSETRERGLYINRGDCFYKQEDLQFALADFMQALEMEPADASVQARISLIYHRFGQNSYSSKDYQSADSSFTEAISYNPTVPYFWVVRARTRYTMGDHDGARKDILSALLLDPDQETLISLMARLFPSKTTEEVLESSLAHEAQCHLRALIAARQTDVVPEVEERRSTKSGRSGSSRKSRRQPIRESTIPTLKSCVSEIEMSKELVSEKRTLEKEMDKMFEERRTLRPRGPKVLPLPRASSFTRKGASGKKEILLDEKGMVVQKAASTGWKHFSTGVGI